MNEKKTHLPEGIGKYQKTEVLTANRETILLMLYAGAIRFLRTGIEAAKAGQLSAKCENITRSQRIVSELRATLNFEAAEEIAGGLDALYAFITRRLVEGVASSETTGLEEALKLLEDLNHSWEKAVAQIRAGASGSQG